jgi:hypothetical protein
MRRYQRRWVRWRREFGLAMSGGGTKLQVVLLDCWEVSGRMLAESRVWL